LKLFSKSANTEIGTTNLAVREQWLKNTLAGIPAGYRILDAGAGELPFKKYCSHLKYVSQDFGKYDGKRNEQGLHFVNWENAQYDIVSDVVCIPEQDESFDAVMCVEVFEHLPEPVAAIKEFSRLLKKKGTLILTAPFCSLTHFAPYHFYSGFNRYFYEKHLPEHGFQIEEITPNGNYFEYIAQEIRFRLPNKYTEAELSKREKKAFKTVLNMLQRMNESDKNSSELLCFGYHVKAVKL
jgi:ubiquinone/menaquinone biosynthesis C-methylase UbiE